MAVSDWPMHYTGRQAGALEHRHGVPGLAAALCSPPVRDLLNVGWVFRAVHTWGDPYPAWDALHEYKLVPVGGASRCSIVLRRMHGYLYV